MKKVLTVSLVTALIVSLATPAKAINEEWSAVAGFVGGVLAAKAFDNGTTYQKSYCSTPRIERYYYEPMPCEPRGHYEYRTERVWISGRRQVEYDNCGRRREYWTPGYYETYQTKVWVSYR